MTAHAERRSRFVTVDGLEIHYSEWGNSEGEPVVCAHGFSRNGRAFDALARRLGEAGYRVLCPDVPGRGLSEWSQDPETDYRPYAPGGLARYLEGFVDGLDAERVRWVGTSMGGAIGIRLAGTSLRERISHLVVNDIGPGAVDPDPTDTTHSDHIARYRDPPRFRTLAGLEGYFEDLYGDCDSAVDVRHLTLTSARRTDDGAWTHGYDPAIVDAYLAELEAEGPKQLWEEWDRITAKTLVLRGTATHILPVPEFEAMQERGPETTVVEYEGVGHAPSLDTDDQTETIRAFLTD